MRLSPSAPRIPQHEISYSVSGYFRIGDNVDLVFRIRNLGNSVIPVGDLMVLDNGYFSRSAVPVPEIGPYKEQRVPISVYVRGGASILQISKDFSITYHSRTKYFCFSTLTSFCKLFQSFTPVNADLFNVLFFGICRTGKSSLINKILTLLETDPYDSSAFQDAAKVGGGLDRHVTLDIRRYVLKTAKLALWDTWGVGPDNYLDGTLLKLLHGELPGQGFTINSVMDEETVNALQSARNTRHKRRIHACVICITPEWIKSLIEGNGIAESFKDGRKYPLTKVREIVVDLFLKLRYLNPMVVICKSDVVGGDLAKDPLTEPENVTLLRASAADLLRVPMSSVYTNVNYTKERTRDWSLDKLTYIIVKDIMNRARDFEEQYGHQEANLNIDGKPSGFVFD